MNNGQSTDRTITQRFSIANYEYYQITCIYDLKSQFQFKQNPSLCMHIVCLSLIWRHQWRNDPTSNLKRLYRKIGKACRNGRVFKICTRYKL